MGECMPSSSYPGPVGIVDGDLAFLLAEEAPVANHQLGGGGGGEDGVHRAARGDQAAHTLQLLEKLHSVLWEIKEEQFIFYSQTPTSP